MLRQALLPLLLATALALAHVADQHVSAAVAITVAVVASAVVVWLLERWIPYRRTWRPARPSVWVDAMHTLVSASLVSPAVRLVTLAAFVGLAGRHCGPWPGSLPLIAQVALAVVAADLGAYLAHRAMHRFEAGWRIHAVHHSPRGLYWLAAGRAHPLNAFATLTAESVPLLLLGVEPEVFLLASVFKAVNGMVQHSNIDVRSAWLNRVVATAECHRWHHASHAVDSSSNFGNTTMIWDQVFGTFRNRDRPVPSVGIDGVDIPESYVAHLLVPWRYDRHRVRLRR